MAEYIERDKVADAVLRLPPKMDEQGYGWLGRRGVWQMLCDFPTENVVPIPETGIGDLSDGYHTFNGLYYQRMVLFAALVKQNKDKSWKSLRHEDGELCFGGGWFIVGIDTPSGSYTYHYEDNFWSMFDCQELPVAKHWDGHTEKDVTRLLSLADVQPVVHGKWVQVHGFVTPGGDPVWECSECGKGMHVYGIEHGTYGSDVADGQWVACPNCGARMDGE